MRAFAGGLGVTRPTRGVVVLGVLLGALLAPAATALPVGAADPPPVDTATLVRATPTSAWAPGSPDPAGVAWIPGADRLVVVDSEVEEVTGAGWNGVNVWFAERNGTQTGTGTMWGADAALVAGQRGYAKEPTGVTFDATGNRLFVTDDAALKIWVVAPGPDGVLANADDVVTAIDLASLGLMDPEDPVYDPDTGDLFWLEGVATEVYRMDPVDGTFGNGDDVVTHFDIGHLGPIDFEGLARDPHDGTLYVGARSTKQIFEVDRDGSLLRTIDVSSLTTMRFLSGLEVAPSSTVAGQTSLFIVDRAVDNANDAAENDGMLYEISAPNVGPPPANLAPVVNAGLDQTVSLPTATATLTGTVSDDGKPAGGTVTTTWSQVTGDAPAVFGSTSSLTTSVSFIASGTYRLRLTASDGEVTAVDDVFVTVKVKGLGIDVSAISATGNATATGTTAQARVALIDKNGVVAAGASVSGTWYQNGVSIGNKTAKADTSGVALISTSKLRGVARGTAFQFCVTGLGGIASTLDKTDGRTHLVWDTGIFQPSTKTDCATWTVP
jgi:hypothetical protein